MHTQRQKRGVPCARFGSGLGTYCDAARETHNFLNAFWSAGVGQRSEEVTAGAFTATSRTDNQRGCSGSRRRYDSERREGA